jgi:hypothetical protein
MTKASDNDFPSLLVTEQGSTPTTPAASHDRLFVRSSDHLLCLVNSSGTVTPVGAAASGSITASGYTQNTAKLLGRTTGSSGAIEEITVGSGLTLSAGSLTASGGGGGVLGATKYDSGSDSPWASSSSGTDADIDATHGSLAITVPASGNILAMIELDFVYGTANNGGFVSLRTGSTTLGTAACISGNIASGGIGVVTASAGHLTAFYYATGLTPGALTLKAGFFRIGSTVLNVYAHDGTGASGHLGSPFVMAAWAV